MNRKPTFRNLQIILLFIISFSVYGQHEIITIAEGKEGGKGPNDPTIFINPRSPNIMVAGFENEKNMQTSNTVTGHGKVYYSKDYGKTWQVRNTGSKYGDFGDPCIIADNEGQFYYFHLSDPEKMGWDGNLVMDRVVCQRSSKGRIWNGGASIGHDPPKKNERCWAAFDEVSGRIYVTWTQYDNFDSSNPEDSARIMFSYSDNRGKSFMPAVRINTVGGNCGGDKLTPIGAMPVAGPGEDLYVTWAYDEKIYFDRSSDGGITWLKNDVVVADQPGGWHAEVPGFGKASTAPVIGCDMSYGEYHGTIYVNWADQRNGENNTDIWLSKSTDRGNTWTEPLRINDDEVTMMGRHQCYNRMAVDPVTGYIYIVFYDRRNHDDLKTDVYLAVSTDGGETFKNEKISEQPFEPDPDIYMGDYINIAAYGGFIRPIWTVQENGKLKLLMAIINPQ